MMNMNRVVICVATLAMAFGTVGAAKAGSGNHQHVRIANCAGEKMLVCTFNGDDSATNNEHDFKRLPNGDKVRLSCHGHGKGGCKVKADSRHTADCGKCQGKLWSGRKKGYFKILGDGDNDLVEIDETKYQSSSPCS